MKAPNVSDVIKEFESMNQEDKNGIQQEISATGTIKTLPEKLAQLYKLLSEEQKKEFLNRIKPPKGKYRDTLSL